MRWLTNLFLFLFVVAVFAAGLLFLLGNPDPVTLELFVTEWQPSAAVGQMLLLFFLAGLLVGVVAGSLAAGIVRRRRRSGVR